MTRHQWRKRHRLHFWPVMRHLKDCFYCFWDEVARLMVNGLDHCAKEAEKYNSHLHLDIVDESIYKPAKNYTCNFPHVGFDRVPMDCTQFNGRADRMKSREWSLESDRASIAIIKSMENSRKFRQAAIDAENLRRVFLSFIDGSLGLPWNSENMFQSLPEPYRFWEEC